MKRAVRVRHVVRRGWVVLTSHAVMRCGWLDYLMGALELVTVLDGRVGNGKVRKMKTKVVS